MSVFTARGFFLCGFPLSGVAVSLPIGGLHGVISFYRDRRRDVAVVAWAVDTTGRTRGSSVSTITVSTTVRPVIVPLV